MAEPLKSGQIDPGREHLGGVYAKALIGAAENAGNTDQVLEEFASFIDDVWAKLPKFSAAMESPRVSTAAKEAMLDRAFDGKMRVELLRFLKIVARRGRMQAVPAMFRAAERLVNVLRGRVEVRVQTAEPLDPPMVQLVQNQLETALKSQVQLRLEVRPELIGGMVVRVGDTVFDTSLAERLRQMKKVTREQTATQIRRSLERFTVDA